MNEEFEIALSLAIDESSISRVKARIEELKKELQTTVKINIPEVEIPEMSSPVITPKIDTTGMKNYTAQIEEAKNKVQDLEANIETLGSDALPSDVRYYNVELEKAKNNLASLIDKQNKLNSTTKKLSFQKVADAIEDSVKSAKLFTMALIGARSVYFGIRKAMSTYLSQNEELQNKLNACYYAIGSLFAPALEYIVNLFAKLIGYVNVFLKALGFAGINMSNFGKSASSSAKSTKDINKSLSGFDEINNIGSDDTSSSGGGGSADVSNPFENQNLDLTWVERIQAFGEWCTQNIPLISGLLLGVAGAIAAIKLGCDGIQALGIGLMIGGIVGAIASLIEYIKSPSWESFGGIIEGIGVAIIGLGLLIGSVPLAIAGAIVLIAGYLASHWEAVKQFLQNIEDGLGNAILNIREWLTNNFGIMGTSLDVFISGTLGLVKGLVAGVREFLDGLFTGIREIIDGIIQICNGDLMGGLSTILKGLFDIIKGIVKGIWEVIKNTISTIWDSIVNFFTDLKQRQSQLWNDIKSAFGTFISTMWSKISGFFSNVVKGFGDFWSNMATKAKTWVKNIINKYIISPINNVINWINQKLHFNYSGLTILGKQVIPGFDVQLAHLNTLPQLNVGTNYVPNDMVAQLHQGEAVIPKKFNTNEYFENINNNDQTNMLLERLINRVENLEMNPYITVKDIGKASVKYINSQSRIKGISLV